MFPLVLSQPLQKKTLFWVSILSVLWGWWIFYSTLVDYYNALHYGYYGGPPGVLYLFARPMIYHYLIDFVIGLLWMGSGMAVQLRPKWSYLGWNAVMIILSMEALGNITEPIHWSLGKATGFIPFLIYIPVLVWLRSSPVRSLLQLQPPPRWWFYPAVGIGLYLLREIFLMISYSFWG
ncbi:MAG: hypothetical protein ACFB10_19445 [Salibacteraceae bacterium]